MATSAWLRAIRHSPPLSLKSPILLSAPLRSFSSSSVSTRSIQEVTIDSAPFLSKISTHSTSLKNSVTQHSFQNLLLRDSSQHPAHIHPDSRQKLYRTSDIPLEGEIVSHEILNVDGKQCVELKWSTPIEGMRSQDAVTSLHSLAWIESGGQIGNESSRIPAATTWTSASLLPTLSTTTFEDYMSIPARRHAHLDSLIKNGIAFFDKMPVAAGSDGVAPLKRVINAVSAIRHTWYGDLFDVKAVEGSKNIAYTNLDLGLHMDLTPFESPPRYQYLHCLNNTSITGGESYFVDSFHVATIIRQSHPAAYKTLCDEPVLFEYKNNGHHTRWTRPTIESAPFEPGQDASSRAPWAVNYSPVSQGQLNASPDANETILEATERLHALHAALKLFASLCDSPEMHYRVQMQPGDCVVFDNRRVLHARTSFEFNDDEPKEGEERGRWLKGAYMDGDEVWSQWRVGEALRLKALEHGEK